MKKPRDYQNNIYTSIIKNGNTLVVLPTGMGKTLIAIMLIKHQIELGTDGISIFLSPTKPLVKQHVNTIKNELKINVASVSGDTKQDEREKLYNANQVIVGTPQTVRNDIEVGILDPDKIKLLIVDEAHRAVGKYAYSLIGQSSKKALIVGLTASPGSDRSRVNEVMKNLNIKNLEVRRKNDLDVKPYTHETEAQWIRLDLTPTYRLISNTLKTILVEYSGKLKKIIGITPPIAHKGKFMQLRSKIMEIRSGAKYAAIVSYTILLHTNHMIELVETQGIEPLNKYLEGLKQKEGKSAKILVRDERIKLVEKYAKSNELHPKTKKLIEIVDNEIKNGKHGIVFVQYRDQISHIVRLLQEKGLRVKPFVGKRKGTTRKDQEKTIEEFRNGDLDILIASSIGEEGLDIPSVDIVIFYEPIPSEIRNIQRRGRTGRFRKGKVIILIANDTRDAYYYMASVRREKKMYSTLNKIQRSYERTGTIEYARGKIEKSDKIKNNKTKSKTNQLSKHKIKHKIEDKEKPEVKHKIKSKVKHKTKHKAKHKSIIKQKKMSDFL